MDLARIAFLGALAIGGATAVVAADSVDRFSCAFGAECIGTERPCAEDKINQVSLNRTADGWVLHSEDGTQIPFVQIGEKDSILFNLLSTRADPAASAVMLLSVAPNGRALLSTHGVFGELQVVVHSGICRPELG